MDGCKLDMEFVNGWKYVMSLAHVRMYDFNKHIEQLNDNIEFQRNLDDYDDELEDDVAYLK